MRDICLGFFILVCLGLLPGCNSDSENSTWRTNGSPIEAKQTSTLPVITIADIDPHTPTSRMLKLRPLADMVAKGLGWEASRVKIRIAQSVDQVASMLRDGRVDLYIDSSYPTLLVARKAGSEVVLRTEVDGQLSYRSLLISPEDSGIKRLEDLAGKTIAFQERYSTSGYLLPAALLQQGKFSLQYTADSGRQPDIGRTGFFFSGDEENTLALLRKDIVVAGAISSHDYGMLDPEVKSEFRILAETREVPRKLISVRRDFDKALTKRIINVLIGFDEADRQQMVRENSWNWKFEHLDDDSLAGIAAIEGMIDQLSLVTP